MLVILREEANTRVLCECFAISWGRAVATLAVLAILYSFFLSPHLPVHWRCPRFGAGSCSSRLLSLCLGSAVTNKPWAAASRAECCATMQVVVFNKC